MTACHTCNESSALRPTVTPSKRDIQITSLVKMCGFQILRTHGNLCRTAQHHYNPIAALPENHIFSLSLHYEFHSRLAF
jgi:hypothetical protein